MVEYSKDKELLFEGLEPVRLRPGMYIGGTEAYGLHHMTMEVVSNSLDQVLAGYAQTLRVDLDEHGWLTVEDDGRGISIAPMHGEPFVEFIFTHLSNLPTVDGHHPHVHLTPRVRGIGVGPVCALSARLEVESRIDGQRWRAAFERGVCVERVNASGPTNESGTRVRFLPDEQIFRGRKIDAAKLRTRLKELAQLLSTLRIHFQGDELTTPSGLRGWVVHAAPDIVAESVVAHDSMVGDVHVEFALGWSPTSTTPQHDSFVNLTRTEQGGTHVTALISALEKSAPSPALWERAKHGFVSIVHVGLLHPRFGGPTRAMLSSEEATPAVFSAVRESIAPAFWDAVQTARTSRK